VEQCGETIFCRATFKQGLRKLMNVTRTLTQFHLLHISTLPTYSWVRHNYNIRKHCVSRDNEVPSRTIKSYSEGQTRSLSTYQYSKLRHFVIINGSYVFVNILNATMYAIGKLIVSSSNELFHCTDLYRYI